MSTVGSSNPEYVTARVRARRSQLFADEDYRKLVRMSTAEIARFMEESAYETEINALGARHSGVDLVEYALNRNLAKQFDDILDWAEGRLYDLIARYLRKFDAWNVKTVIRGLYSDADREEIEADLIRAGEFSDRLVGRLLDAGSIEEVVDVLDRTMFGPALAAALEEYESSGVLVPLENAVDRVFYENLLSEVTWDEATQQYRDVLMAEVDFRNARNALRLARSGADVDPAEYYIEGGLLFTSGSATRRTAATSRRRWTTWRTPTASSRSSGRWRRRSWSTRRISATSFRSR
jgi:V/A-type H+-transporting ATPase subunit C